jgi:hypothetical protein
LATTLEPGERSSVYGCYHDAAVSDDERRGQLFSGAVHVSSANDASSSLIEFARELIEEAFSPHDPRTAQFSMTVEEYAALLGDLKPRFIHHPRSKELIRDLLREYGCDLELTYFDVPRLRSSTSDGFLTSGIAYAWHPHRDTWYSAPLAQINFWTPVYPVSVENAMAFHPEHFARCVPNDSHGYNYYAWNAHHRHAAVKNVTSETRPLPRPDDDIDTSDALVIVPPVGGVIRFSGQHLHSSVPNYSGQTRFSIDFRTVHIGDIRAGRSAPNVDAQCTGSSIRDFIRAEDFAAMPDDVVARFADGTEQMGQLTFDRPPNAPVS